MDMSKYNGAMAPAYWEKWLFNHALVCVPDCVRYAVHVGGRVLCVCRCVCTCLCGCEGSALVRVPIFSGRSHFDTGLFHDVPEYIVFGQFLMFVDKSLSFVDKCPIVRLA